jgi:Uma2 family endonuclease
MAQDTKTRLTVDEFWRLAQDDQRLELVDGDVIEMTPAGAEHSEIGLLIGSLLLTAARSIRAGRAFGADCGFALSLDPPVVRAPDAAFVRADRTPKAAELERFFPGAPDLAVEVISPDDTMAQLLEKVDEYLAAGTQLVWIVAPRRREVYVYRPTGSPEVIGADGTLTADPILPGFSVTVRDLFPG